MKYYSLRHQSNDTHPVLAGCTESCQKWEGLDALQKFYRELLGNETLQGFKLKFDMREWKQQLMSVRITASFQIYSEESIGMKARICF